MSWLACVVMRAYMHMYTSVCMKRAVHMRTIHEQTKKQSRSRESMTTSSIHIHAQRYTLLRARMRIKLPTYATLHYLLINSPPATYQHEASKMRCKESMRATFVHEYYEFIRTRTNMHKWQENLKPENDYHCLLMQTLTQT